MNICVYSSLKILGMPLALYIEHTIMLLIFKVSGVTCVVDVQLLPMYAQPDLVIEDFQEAVSFSSTHWLLYLGNRPLFVIGASLPNDHYSFLTVDILLPWSISQRHRLYTAPTEPISCIISEPKTCRMASISVIGVSVQLMILKDKKVLFRLRTSGSPSRPPNGGVPCDISFSVAAFHSRRVSFSLGEMAFYVMPDEFYRIGVLDSTLSDQGDLMELSSYAVVLASTASPSSPNSFLLVALEIHLVSPGSLIGVRADLTCILFRQFSHFQTLSFGYINVVFDYEKLFGASVAGIQVKEIFGFLYSPVNTSILGFIVSFLFFVLSSILVVVVLPLSMTPAVTS
ncbi:hypothetical protein HID58_085766 [Brassica napus]|uniref:Uncharacterized protein n=1 Tax=Brassica napus TaxID=3708 RepID=A0ABQ7XRD4_BRANA|nr:hypothetical protein HID58_085766 [Brassica napus]